jgi:MOSC domain-containing protein YiiM
MNARVIDLVAGDKRFWPLAGDQLFVDFDLSEDNLLPGAKLAIGAAIIQISAHPHRGCHKFAARFGAAATKFVNSPMGCRMQLRGLCAVVVQSGTIKAGDTISKV